MMEISDGRKRRAVQTRARILDGARREFLENGYAGASMKSIADRSGVTQSLIHHHFGFKKQLWETIQEEGFQEVLKATRPVVSRALKDPAFPVILFEAYFDYLAANPDYVRLLGWTFVIRDEAGRSLPGQATQLVEVIRKLQHSGKLNRALDPAVCLALIWSLAEGWFLGRSDYERRLGHPPEGEAMVGKFREGAVRLIRETLAPERHG